MSSQNKVAWKYTSDDGVEYVRFASKAITDQLDTGTPKVGGEAADGTEEPMPRSFKPRKALVSTAAGILRSVVAYTNTALILTKGTAITLETGGSDVSFETYGHRGEVPTKSRVSST